VAAYTSTQNGNFSDSATWGGNTPADGDTFTINHTVTLTGANNPTNGYGDITVANNGILTNADNASLRMNGNIRVQTSSSSAPATVHFKDRLTVSWNGANGDNHGFQVDNSAGSHCIIEGDDPTGLCTTTTAATDGNVCTHSVADGSLYAAGDWIQIYQNNYTSTSTENDGTRYDDEGFWIHEVSGNTIYTRDYVGPEDVTITAVDGAKITVTNAKVFRVGMQVIFGTGSNRNIHEIDTKDHTTNIITLDSAVTGSVVGATVYRAASLKPHPSGSKVRKMATVTTAESASGASTITVASTSGMSVGNRLWIEKRSEATSTTDYADSNSGYDYVISAINGNVVTLTTTLGYKVVATSLVSILDRSIVFNTVATDGSDYAHFYVEHRSGYDRCIILKDIQFDNWGDDDNNVRTGVVVRGQNKTQSPPVTLTQTVPVYHRGSWVEGLTVRHYAGHERDWGSIWIYDCRATTPRCCTTLYGDDGISIYYEPYCGAIGNIAAGQRSYGMRLEGSTELFDCSYNYLSRNNNRLRCFHYEEGIGGTVHNCIVDATDYASAGWYHSHPGNFWRCKFTGLRHRTTVEGPVGPESGFTDCMIKSLSGEQTIINGERQNSPAAGQYRQSHYNRGGSMAPTLSIEHDFEEDAMAMYGYNWEAHWDADEDAWHFLRRDDNDNNPSIGEVVYIPAGATGRFTAKVKGVTGFSGSYPNLFAIDCKSTYNENALGFTATTNRPLRGKRYNVAYSSAMESGYEEEQITITSEPYSRWYKIGIRSSNRNATEGFYVKDFKFFIDGVQFANRLFLSGGHGNVNINSTPMQRSSFTQQKKRIGGRLK
jgi:hypothetical protein